MPEILTESFCERCGTRYTFESAAPRKARRLGQFKTLSKGMKNWVMSDDTSLDEAMAAARNDDERELTSQQLDAFHATFNFCMTCRQYTCGNCWNASEGHCLTCAPHLGHEILPAPFPDAAGLEPVRIEAEAWPEVDLSVTGAALGNGATNGNGNGNGLDHAADDPWAGATADAAEIADFDPAARLAFLSGEAPAPTREPEPEQPARQAEPFPSAEAAPAAEVEPAPPWIVASDDVMEPPPVVEDVVRPEAIATTGIPVPPGAVPPPAVTPLPDTIEGRVDAGAARTSDLLRRFRPGQNIDAELAAYEAEMDRAGAEAGPSEAPAPIAAAPEPVAAEPIAAAAQPIAAEPEPEQVVAASEPVAPEPEPGAPEPVAVEPVVVEPPADVPAAASAAPAEPPAPEPSPAWPQPAPAEPPREDRILQPTWQIFAPDATPSAPGPADVPSLPAPTQPVAGGVPQWPVRPDQGESPAMALLANRANRSPSDALWAASAQEVLAPPASAPAAGATTGVQPCSSCGLSLSATARFCRRCGTRQG